VYPGNTNGILLSLPEYEEALRGSGGAVREFVNPKYADAERRCFRRPARLECMMQDIAWLMQPRARADGAASGGRSDNGCEGGRLGVGFTSVPPEWGYFPSKNDRLTAAQLSAKGIPPYSAATAEFALYNAHASALRALGAEVAPPQPRSFHGVSVPLGPAVIFSPCFAPCMSALARKLGSPQRLSVSRKSALLVTGRHIRIDELRLDGSLEISVADGASLHIRSLVVQNEGWRFEDLSPTVLEDGRCPEVLQMRGYTLRREQARQVAVTTPGHHEMDHGELVLVSRTAVSFCDGAADLTDEAPPQTSSAASQRDGGRLSFGGALEGQTPPPARAAWCSSALSLQPGAELRVPLVLPVPSLVRYEVQLLDASRSSLGLQPSLVLSLLPSRGEAVLPPTLLDTAAGSPPPGTIHVPGSGIFHLVLQNTSLLREATVSAAVTHRPAEGGPSAAAAEEEKRAEAVERAAELAVLRQQDEALAASEKELSQRLWEVQETRRRQAAMMELVQRDIATLQGRGEGEGTVVPLRTANAP